jgi:3-phosphoshikimate 1-carboxyvinyltransferase
MTDAVTVHPSPRISGTVRVPGDKSISQRVAMLSAVASGVSRIRGFLLSDDGLAVLRALERLGARFEIGSEQIVIEGTAGRFRQPDGSLDLGNSGTGMRLLAGLVAGQPITVELTGDASLRSRPMRRIQEPLERMGARVALLGANGCAPIRITGGRLRGIRYVLPVASAQVKSCVLLAGLFAEGETVVVEPRPTRDHTENLLREAGLPLAVDGTLITVRGGGRVLASRTWTVPGDFSSAAFWIVAGALRRGDATTVLGVGLNPRRTALLEVLRRMGAKITVSVESEAAGGGEPVGGVTAEGRELSATEIGGDEIPNLIDEIPIIAVAAAMANGRTVIRDAAELRVKESDRIAAIAENLRRMGVGVEEKPDGMIITGPVRPHARSALFSHGDHRIAMAMAVLALLADAPVRIDGAACAAKSYPEFWNDLSHVGGHAELHRHD